MNIKELLKKLDQDGNTGLDMSPGDPVAKEAARVIRLLMPDIPTKFNTKKYQSANALLKLRIWHKKATKRLCARYVIKCGCCDEKLEIYPAQNEIDGMEIGGVIASKEEWRRILLPLLNE